MRRVLAGLMAGVVFFFAVGIAESLRTQMLSWSGQVASPIVTLSAAVALVVTVVVHLVARRRLVNVPGLTAFAGALLLLTAVTWARDSMPTVLTPHRLSWQLAASQAANSLVTAAAFGVALAAATSELLAQDRERVRQCA